MTMPTPPVLNRIHPVIWATALVLAAAAVLMAPACSALQEASKETSAIGRAGKAVEGQADGVASDAQAAKDALAKARQTGGVGPEAEPFRRGGGDGHRLDPLAGRGYPWAWSGDSGPRGGNPSAFDGLDRETLALDWSPEVGWHRGGVSLPAGSGDLLGSWGGDAPGLVGCWSLGEFGNEGHGEAGRGGDGRWAPRPVGGSGPARSVGSPGAGDGPGLQRGLRSGEAEGGGVARAWSYPGPHIALAGLSDAGYLDLIVCFWLAMLGQWLAGKAGVGSGNILKRLLGWLATRLGAVQPPAQTTTNPPEPPKPS